MADRLPPQRGNRALELEEQVRDVLVGCGLQEVITYSLTNLAREAAIDPEKTEGDLDSTVYVSLSNPITQERSVMRRTLLAHALETAADNLRFRDRVQLYEIGKVFLLEPGAELPQEPLRLSILMTGARGGRHWLSDDDAGGKANGPRGSLDFFDLKGVVETLLARLHVTSAVYEPAEHPTFQVGRTARLQVGGREIGFLGEIDPTVRSAFGLRDHRVAAAHLDLDVLLSVVPAAWFVEPISAYPAVLQDLAVVVDEEVPAAAVQALIAQAGGFLLKGVRLFDVYRGDPVPAGKKSLAYALTFQAPDKTLRDAIVAKQVKRIVGRLRGQLGAELRA
jgi:phenylalanyl-tRNA synthetase beta chain